MNKQTKNLTNGQRNERGNKQNNNHINKKREYDQRNEDEDTAPDSCMTYRVKVLRKSTPPRAGPACRRR